MRSEQMFAVILYVFTTTSSNIGATNSNFTFYLYNLFPHEPLMFTNFQFKQYLFIHLWNCGLNTNQTALTSY